MYRYALLTLLSLPLPTFAQGTLQSLITNTATFLQSTVIPALLAIAFLLIVINMLRYFVWRSHDEDGRTAAKYFAIYATAAFVLFVIFAGVVNFFANSLGANTAEQPCPDYIALRGGCSPGMAVSTPPSGSVKPIVPPGGGGAVVVPPVTIDLSAKLVAIEDFPKKIPPKQLFVGETLPVSVPTLVPEATPKMVTCIEAHTNALKAAQSSANERAYGRCDDGLWEQGPEGTACNANFAPTCVGSTLHHHPEGTCKGMRAPMPPSIMDIHYMSVWQYHSVADKNGIWVWQIQKSRSSEEYKFVIASMILHDIFIDENLSIAQRQDYINNQLETWAIGHGMGPDDINKLLSYHKGLISAGKLSNTALLNERVNLIKQIGTLDGPMSPGAACGYY